MSAAACLSRLLFPEPPPGLALLDRHLRLHLRLRALRCFVASIECVRMLLYLSVWILAGLHLIWWLDRPPPDQVLAVCSAWPWLWLWTTHASHRWVQSLLSDAGDGGHVSS